MSCGSTVMPPRRATVSAMRRLATGDRYGALMSSSAPVLLVHGWGGSFADTWQQTGFTALLEDAGRTVVGVDLLGHGTAPKPHEPEAYADLGARIVEALPAEPVDAIGFSLGAVTLLGVAMRRPAAFSRLVIAAM